MASLSIILSIVLLMFISFNYNGFILILKYTTLIDRVG